MKRNIVLWTFILVFVALALPARAQTPPVRYFYDDLGRLTKVVDQSGIHIDAS
jgi:hypothetical protein